MITYHKIQTVFLRDPETKFQTLLEGEFAKPEFAYLANSQWQWTEKVDGTNIRVIWKPADFSLIFHGKTDNANTPRDLLRFLETAFTVKRMMEVFPDTDVCLYGEGYGAGIQKVGRNYQQDKRFILFDVKIGDMWLERHNVEDVAQKLECPVVPIVGTGTLWNAVELVRRGYRSWIAENKDFLAEGLIMRPTTELMNRRGERVITKIKYSDFGPPASAAND